jgi:hypothetical protein
MVKPTRDWSPGESAISSGVSFCNLRGRKGEEVKGRSSFAKATEDRGGGENGLCIMDYRRWVKL